MTSSHNIITIPKAYTQIQALSYIKKEKEHMSWSVKIDFRHVNFTLTRDILFVLKERFRPEDVVLIVESEKARVFCRTFGFIAEVWKEASLDYSILDKNILAYNLSMWEYFLYEIRRGWQYVSYFVRRKFLEKKKIHVFHKTSPHFFLIVTWLIVSVTLLLFIFHFAVSKTIISITPQISVRPVSANIIYSSISGSVFQWKNVLPLKTLSIPVDISMNFALTVVDSNSTANAEGIIIIYNELESDQALKPLTRFVSENGEVFRLKWWVNVPRSQSINGVTEIGSAEATVTADGNDEAWRIIGLRWNIKRGTDLTIPGLKFNRDKVYAKAKGDFVGGTDPQIFIVTEDEVKKFESILRAQLFKKSQSDLQAALEKGKQNFWEDYALLSWENITYTGETIVMTSPYKFWESAHEVTLRWHVQVNALTYDRKATIDYLRWIFEESLLQWTEKYIALHEDTLRVASIVSKAEDNTRIKATMEMTVSTTFDFENITNELTRNMKIMIAGLSRDEAVSKLINNGHIKEVDIEFSPFWIRTISSKNIDSIEFVIKK